MELAADLKKKTPSSVNLHLGGGTCFEKDGSKDNVLVSKLCYLQHTDLQFYLY